MKVSVLRMLLLYCIFVFCCCTTATTTTATQDTVAVNIGVIYDKKEELGKMGYNCINMGVHEFYNTHSHYKTRIALHPKHYNSSNSIIGAASAALYLLKYKEVKAIFVPTTSVDAEFVIHLGESAQVPILSYSDSVTTPCVSSAPCSYSISMSQNESLQVEAITAIIQKFQWKYVIPIYVDSHAYRVGIIPSLDDALQKISAHIPFHEPISQTATLDQIRQLLHKLKALQTRVFVVDLSLDLASRFFLLANELGMTGPGYVWITTTSIRNEFGSLDDSVKEFMEGVVGVQTYVPNTYELKRFKSRWERDYQDIKLNVMGLWAYDAACALARAVEQVADPNSSFKNTKITLGDTITDLDNFGLSPVGPELLKALQSTSISGLAGNFGIVNGQLRSPPLYKIINMLESGNNGVGFWTSEKGLVPRLNFPGKNAPTNSSLRQIIWPGDAIVAPKGWEIPASGKKLRVGVPVKQAYEQLVNVTCVQGTNGSATNCTSVTGFCIDIFDEVMKKIGYSKQHYEYIPYMKQDCSRNGTYDELVQQVFDQNYDAVVGDITIIAKRTKYVDFTLPFTESGVTMVVPVKDDKQSAWVFLQPLTWDLWMATLSAFIFIAFTIWVLEHRTNEEFRGSPSHQVGASLFYSFSMMVFAHRENVSSNLSRCVVVVWVFVVLVITQSYTASLTSTLTVQQLQPTVTDVGELIREGAFVGVQNGTFVKDLLIQKGFHESKIVSYNTSENLDDLLSKGSGNGGIAAVFDEIPYMKLFLANRSSNYTMLLPIYKTDGFGFAFPIGSPLASEVSKGILNVTEGDEMGRLEMKWDLQLYNSSNQGNEATSTRLTLDSFLGLFLIVGVSTGLALLVFWVQFLHEHRHIWMHSDASVWSRAQKLAEVFQSRDMAARKKDAQSTQNVGSDQISIDCEGADLHTAIPPRPSNYSDTPITEDGESFPVSAGVSPSP